MPRRDSVTGVSVMTAAEFWRAEAEREGRDPWVLQHEFCEQLEAECRRQEQALRDPAAALGFLVECAKQADDAVRRPIAVQRVCDVAVTEGIAVSMTRLRAIVRCDDGRTWEMTARAEHRAGTYAEPPEDGVVVGCRRVVVGLPIGVSRGWQCVTVSVGAVELLVWWALGGRPGPAIWGVRTWSWWRRVRYALGIRMRRR